MFSQLNWATVLFHPHQQGSVKMDHLKWEQWVWSQSRCLLNPIVCHYPHLSAIQISLKESRKERSQHQGIRGISDVWFLPKAPQGTVVSPEYKRQRHHKLAAAYLELTKAARAVSNITHAVLPPSQTRHRLPKLSHCNRKQCRPTSPGKGLGVKYGTQSFGPLKAAAAEIHLCEVMEPQITFHLRSTRYVSNSFTSGCTGPLK